MPAKNCLSLSEKKNLQEALKREENPKVRERILMFLLLDDSKNKACNSRERNVSSWLISVVQ